MDKLMKKIKFNVATENKKEYEIIAQYIEIYNEKIKDLLNPKN